MLLIIGTEAAIPGDKRLKEKYVKPGSRAARATTARRTSSAKATRSRSSDSAAAKSTTRASSRRTALGGAATRLTGDERPAVVHLRSFFTASAHADDDGEKESHVKERYIKKRSTLRASRSRSRSRLPVPAREREPREGDRVEAFFRRTRGEA